MKNHTNGEYTVIHNDNKELSDVINDTDLYVGFNSKHYDQYIIKAICAGFTPEEIKELNDFIINEGGQGWEYEALKNCYIQFNNVDIMDDMQQGLSLKSIEGHLGMDIEESSVSFDIDRALTQEELELTIKYCKHDVDSTEEILTLRKDYLSTKQHIGELAGISPEKAMSMTNAKLTAAILKARPKEHEDEREYTYPDNLKREYIPNSVFEFFDKLKDKAISDEAVFSGKLEIKIGDCPVTIGYGGIHGAINNYVSEYKDTVIRNFDVASYYPNLMVLYDYTSRNIPSPDTFKEILEQRLKAKKAGNTKISNALKLVVNTTYGGSLNQYNALYDPLKARSVCITGQLFLCELANHLHKDVKDLNIIQINTDGVMIECAESDMSTVYEITKEWQERTGFVLEEDDIDLIAQKDVNNYVMRLSNGDVKSKGGYLVRGIPKAGAFNINNDARIVAKAIKEYFLNNTPVAETINACDNKFWYQLIAKASSKYKATYTIINGEEVPTQRVNRVFASKDLTRGTLYKIKKEDDSVAKIAGLPEHCLIDNNNKATINDIDKNWYIELAKQRVNDFLGIKPERRKMATTKKDEATKTLNIYQKLIKARKMFLEANVKKSGKNRTLVYKYFKLEDIIPEAVKIFEEVGLLSVIKYYNTASVMEMINTDNPEEKIMFTCPFREQEAIISKAGAEIGNSVQRLGSSMTYIRRYLYLAALDIAENDEIEEAAGTSALPASPNSKAPASAEDRKQAKDELTAPDKKATDLQIGQLKKVLKKLLEKKPETEEAINKIGVDSAGFTNFTKTECEKHLTWASEKLKEGE